MLDTQVQQGYVETLQGPGLGIELNENLIRKVDAECRKQNPWRNPKFTAFDGSIQEW